LCHDEVIRFISSNTVPVALNLYLIRAQKDPAGDFFRSVQKQRPEQYQGLYLVAPNGKVLASHQNFKSEKTWAQELLADLEPGLKSVGPMKLRTTQRFDPLPLRGSGLPADGSATLAIYLRYSIKGIPLRELPNPTIDSLTLTSKELALLGPPTHTGAGVNGNESGTPGVGTEWEIPEALARRFSRVLGPNDEDSMPRPPEVTSVKLTGTVQEVEGNIARLAYKGQLSGAHLNQAKKHTHGEARLTGAGRYDCRERRLLSLIWVFDGVDRGAPPYDQPASYSGVVEWTQANSPSAARD
jgi:hypothetical protein